MAARGHGLKRTAPSLPLIALLMSAALPLSAHHSYAMFDKSQVTELHGTVARFEWTNPHVFLWLYAIPPNAPAGDEHKYVLYGFEGGSPGTLIRNGWSQNSVATGEKVMVRFYPLKDGRSGGSLVQVTHADGSMQKAENAERSEPPRSAP